MLEAHITHDQFSIFLCYFSDHSGSPFGDFGPDPVCMPDPDMEDYGDDEGVVYNVVSNPRLKFEENEFHVFSTEVLNFPGANNVPLGSLSLKGNKVGIMFKCFLPFFL